MRRIALKHTEFTLAPKNGGFGSFQLEKPVFGASDNVIPMTRYNIYGATGKKRFSLKWDKSFKLETLDVKNLRTVQPVLDKAENLRPVEDPSTLPPIKVARVNGENVVLDGNHRASSLFLQGHPKIKANVIDLDDPKNASLINRDKL